MEFIKQIIASLFLGMPFKCSLCCIIQRNIPQTIDKKHVRYIINLVMFKSNGGCHTKKKSKKSKKRKLPLTVMHHNTTYASVSYPSDPHYIYKALSSKLPIKCERKMPKIQVVYPSLIWNTTIPPLQFRHWHVN